MFRIAARSASLRVAPRAVFSARTLVTTRFSEQHEWIAFDDETNVGIIGITKYAQNSLGDIVFVELPTPETTVDVGDEMGVVESVKAASDIYSPVSGTIVEVNESLGSNPNLIGESAETEGWLAKIKLSEPEQVTKLMTKEEYTEFCGKS